ncbi:MAG: hypothetical protein KME26_10150 [Oscillatoria princeps RMCB-10]|nr:hypothetical protein [Oscillatoria princeps RMCB-10]
MVCYGTETLGSQILEGQASRLSYAEISGREGKSPLTPPPRRTRGGGWGAGFIPPAVQR